MSVFEAVKKGFGNTFKLKGIILIFFIFNILISFISLPMVNPANAGNPAVIALSIIASIIFFLIFIFLQGGAMGLVRDVIKTGTANLGEFVSYGKKYYSRIFMLLLIYFLIAIAVVLVMALLSTGILLIGDNVFTRSLVAVMVTLVALVIITFLIYPIYSLIVDDVGAIPALKHGIDTSKNNFVKTLGLFIIMLIISLIISLIIGSIAGVATIPLGEKLSRIILAVINSVVQSFIPIIMMVAFMSFYVGSAHGKGN